jgi:hypothetical protein
MKTNCPGHRFSTLLAALGLVAWGVTPAFGQSAVYAARVTSTNTEVWDSPFYWIPNGGTPFGLSTGLSSAPDLPSRLGCYYHYANTMTVGEGFGLVHTRATEPSYGCLRYEVLVTVPLPNASSDVVMSVGSTNCDVSLSYGGSPDETNTLAFQAANSGDRWAHVCYLTCRVGVTQPHVDFKYVSGTAGRLYADCVKFVPPCCSCCVPALHLAIQPPVCTNIPYVTVTGVGLTETLIGQLTNGIVLGNNLVPVTWQADSVGAFVIATRVSPVLGESCHLYGGSLVGNGDLRISSLTGGTLRYTGGSGTLTILLKSSDPGLPLCNWQRAASNSPILGTFTIPAVGTEDKVFYRIKTE